MSNKNLTSVFVEQINTVASKEPLLGVEIVKHLGGVAAFEIVSDVLSLGINIKRINGFKYDSDTTDFFKRNKVAIMDTMHETAKREGLEPTTYLLELCHVHRYGLPLVKECYDILCSDALMAKADEHTMRSVDAAAHQITLAVVTHLIEAYHKSKNSFG